VISVASFGPDQQDRPCVCVAHQQHRLYKFLWLNKGTTLKSAALDLHISYANAKQIKHRLSARKDIHLRCPECFEPSLRGGACTSCGFEMDRPDIPMEIDFGSQSPRYSIQPLGGLGSQTSYMHLSLSYGGQNVKHLVERPKNSLLERCKSDLWQALKEAMPPAGVVEEASLLLSKEVIEFQRRYPFLVSSTKARKQLVDNVMKVLRLRYPPLRKQGDRVTP
jgi:hypothetical protein